VVISHCITKKPTQENSFTEQNEENSKQIVLWTGVEVIERKKNVYPLSSVSMEEEKKKEK
jgi:hypothetical protein